MNINEIKPNTAVFTTNFVLEGNAPILYVTHDSDGDWQFLGDDDLTEENAKLVSIRDILKIDNSIKDLPPLEEGYRAVRRSKRFEWEIYKITE